MNRYEGHYRSPLGPITLASDGTALTGLWFEGQKYYGGEETAHREEALPVFLETRRWLDLYFEGREPDFLPPVSLSGSPFQQAVWAILKEIPYGKTVTYGDIALRLRSAGRKASAQAVGGAVGRNPVSVIVPCHRVLGQGGNLTGYAGGVAKKIALLRLEGTDVSRLKTPEKGTAL